jgi:hypothetical protein
LYNRAGVERVMGFCTGADYEEFFHTAPEFEKMLVRSGIVLIRYWFSITDDEQHLRFMMRAHDRLKQWKLSPMDLESRRRWEQYTKAKEIMLERTHIPEAPWWIVEAVDKKQRTAQLHRTSVASKFPMRRFRTPKQYCRNARTIQAISANQFRRKCTSQSSAEKRGLAYRIRPATFISRPIRMRVRSTPAAPL